MTVETALVAALKAAATNAGNNIFGGTLPEGAEDSGEIPAIVYSKVPGGLRVQNHAGIEIGLYRPRYQLDCWAASYGAAVVLAAQVKTAMKAYEGVTIKAGRLAADDFDLPDIQAGLQRRIVDVYLWNEEG